MRRLLVVLLVASLGAALPVPRATAHAAPAEAAAPTWVPSLPAYCWAAG